MTKRRENEKTKGARQGRAEGRERTMLVIGLGNPGPAYERTYHNIGLEAVEKLAGRSDGEGRWKKADGLFEYRVSENIAWVKPLVFMNESGAAAAAARKRFQASLENILVIHDDSDIELGKWKTSFGRGAAGHKGVASVIAGLGSDRFWRLRIGIRDPKNRKRALDFVLKKIRPADRVKLDDAFNAIPEMKKIATGVAASSGT